jgi:hypothetical protein
VTWVHQNGVNIAKWAAVPFTTAQNTISATGIGDLIVLAIATDNTAETDGASSDHLSVIDDAVDSSNVYTKLAETTTGSPGAGAGVTTSLWVCVATTALTGSHRTAPSFKATNAFAMRRDTFNKSLSSISTLGLSSLDDVAADPGSITLSSLVSAEHLFVRATGHEGPSTDAYTASTSFAGNEAGTTGHGDQDISVALEYRIVSATSQTTDPAWGGSTTDHASIMAALDETSGVPGIYAGANAPVLTIQLDIQGP